MKLNYVPKIGDIVTLGYQDTRKFTEYKISLFDMDGKHLIMNRIENTSLYNEILNNFNIFIKIKVDVNSLYNFLNDMFKNSILPDYEWKYNIMEEYRVLIQEVVPVGETLMSLYK